MSTIKCPDCGQQYTPGREHACRPLHEAMGFEKNQPRKTLPRGHAYNALDEHLPGPDGKPGITRREAIIASHKWWDETGRHLIRTGFVRNASVQDFIPSGILLGKPWAELTAVQAAEVADRWYQYVWLPKQRAGAR